MLMICCLPFPILKLSCFVFPWLVIERCPVDHEVHLGVVELVLCHIMRLEDVQVRIVHIFRVALLLWMMWTNHFHAVRLVVEVEIRRRWTDQIPLFGLPVIIPVVHVLLVFVRFEDAVGLFALVIDVYFRHHFIDILIIIWCIAHRKVNLVHWALEMDA